MHPATTYNDRPCWHCEHWGGWAWGGPHSWCQRPKTPGVIAMPARGCAFFSRAPGADDEAGPPPMPRDVTPEG